MLQIYAAAPTVINALSTGGGGTQPLGTVSLGNGHLAYVITPATQLTGTSNYVQAESLEPSSAASDFIAAYELFFGVSSFNPLDVECPGNAVITQVSYWAKGGISPTNTGFAYNNFAVSSNQVNGSTTTSIVNAPDNWYHLYTWILSNPGTMTFSPRLMYGSSQTGPGFLLRFQCTVSQAGGPFQANLDGLMIVITADVPGYAGFQAGRGRKRHRL